MLFRSRVGLLVLRCCGSVALVELSTGPAAAVPLVSHDAGATGVWGDTAHAVCGALRAEQNKDGVDV